MSQSRTGKHKITRAIEMNHNPDEQQDAKSQSVERPQVVWHQPLVDRATREERHGHRGAVIWLTGLSGCGKSTIADLVDRALAAQGVESYILDGDNIRHGLNAGPDRLQEYGDAFAGRFGLGFSEDDRKENIRRVAAVASLLVDAGIVAIVAFVSPYHADRQTARAYVESCGRSGDFFEVFVDAPLEVCEARDPKGLYQQARDGKIRGFTGIDAPYEPPTDPQLHLKSAEHSPESLAQCVLQMLVNHGVVAGGPSDQTGS